MFKLGVISDEVSQEFQEVVDMATEFDLDSIEIRSVWEKPPQDLTEEDVKRMKEILAGADLQIIGVASPFFKCDIDDPDARKEHIQILRDCIDIAHQFDARIIRTFVFWETGQTEERWQELLDSYEEPVRIAEREDVVLGLENEASTSLATALLTERFIRDINLPQVRAIWDPANEAHAKDGEKPFPDAYQRLRPLMVHGHIKDAGEDENGEMTSVPVGDGVIGWQDQLQAYVDDGYEGHLTLETHWRPKRSLSESLLNEPGGAAFSASGAEASRICLENLKEMISKLSR